MFDWTRPVALGLCVGVAPALSAQGPSGSETHVAISQGIPAGGASATGSFEQLESTVGQSTTGASGSSETFQLTSGVVTVAPPLGSTSPLLFGVREGHGDHDGGQMVELVGFGFAAAGAGSTSASFAGSAAPSVTVGSNTTLLALTPPGTDVLDNPLAKVDVGVANANGSASVSNAFTYAPALLQYSDAYLGASFQFHLLASPGSFYAVVYGGALPGFPFKLNPFGGTLALSNNPVFLVNVSPTATGQVAVALDIPDVPALGGAIVQFQCLSITKIVPPLVGTFTNVLSVSLLP